MAPYRNYASEVKTKQTQKSLDQKVIPESKEVLKEWWKYVENKTKQNQKTQGARVRNSHGPSLGQFEHKNKW